MTWKLRNKEQKLLRLFANPFTQLHWGIHSMNWHLIFNVMCSAATALIYRTLPNCSPYKFNLFGHNDQYFIAVCKLTGGKLYLSFLSVMFKPQFPFSQTVWDTVLFIPFLLHAFFTLWRTKRDWLVHCLQTVVVTQLKIHPLPNVRWGIKTGTSPQRGVSAKNK